MQQIGTEVQDGTKTCQEHNLIDILRRMWVNSNPLVNKERAKSLPFCKKCNVSGHSKRYCLADKKEANGD